MSDPEQLDPLVRAALLSEGLEGGPSDEQRRRMAERLAAVAGISAAALLGGGGGGGPGGGGGGPGGGAGPSGAGGAHGATGAAIGGKTVAVIAGAFMIGGAVGVTVSELRPRDVTPIPAVAIAPAPVPASPPDAVVVDAAVTDAALPPPDDARRRMTAIPLATRDADLVALPDAPAAPSTLARERELIEVARAALRTADYQLAAKNLIEHELRFPDGALREERAVLQIELAMARGDRADAARRAAAFRQAFPTSVFRARVDDLVPR